MARRLNGRVARLGDSPEVRETDRMARSFTTITEPMRSFIEAQHVFFVGTAPLEGGHVNLSPKGYDTFRVLDANRVAYLDLTGSGAETIAHVRENGRITFMFCAFEGHPNIVRLYGTGSVVQPCDAGFDDLEGMFEPRAGVRSIILAEISRTSTSCGFGVPFMDFVAERSRLTEWADARSADEMAAYRAQKNATSIDGLPALDVSATKGETI